MYIPQSCTVRIPVRPGTLICWTLITKLATDQLKRILLFKQKSGHCVQAFQSFRTKFENSSKLPSKNVSIYFLRSQKWSTNASKNSFLKRKMDADFASKENRNLCLFSQSGGLLHSGLFDKTILQIVPKNGLLICTSSLQVHCHFTS